MKRNDILRALLAAVAGLSSYGNAQSSPQFQRCFMIPAEGFTGRPGDVDGDGFDDVLTMWIPPSWPASGVVHARVRSGLNGGLIFDWTPATPSVSGFVLLRSAGDLNGDGSPDIILEPGYQQNLEIWSGSDGSLMNIVPTSAFGWAPNGFFGVTSAAGDLNGDGIPELLIQGGPGGAYTGVEVASGPLLTPLYSYPQNFQLGPLFGFGLAGIDDVTGDGFPDFAIGSSRASAPSPSGPIDFAGWLGVYSGASGSLTVSAFGTQYQQWLGHSVCGMGDVDGDGVPDLACVDFQLGGSQLVLRTGATLSTIYSVATLGSDGSVERLTDVDGDGVDEVLVTNCCALWVHSGATGAVMYNEYWPWYLGGGHSLGDVNGDGLGDFGRNLLWQAYPFSTQLSVQNLTWGWTWPPLVTEGWVYVARNLRVTGPTLVGGNASFSVRVPKHPGRPMQIVFSLEGAVPGMPVGPFFVPLVPDPLFFASVGASLVGTLNAVGVGSLTVPIPANPALQGLEVKASGVVYDPSGPLGIACVLTGEAFTIQ